MEMKLWQMFSKKQPITGDELQKGKDYYYGNGVIADKTKAVILFEKAALNGNVEAQLLTGYMFDFGDGIRQNPKKAMRFYSMAAKNGESNAALNLANMYLFGRGIALDNNKGIYWLEKSAEMGNAHAQSSLGRHYTIGDGVEKSISKAEYWINKAESNGYINSDTLDNLGLMYEEKKDYETAYRCFSKALKNDQDNLNARYLVGNYLFFGKGTTKNVKEAENHLQWIVSHDPDDKEASILLRQIRLYEQGCAALYEQICVALSPITATLNDGVNIWDYQMDVHAQDKGISIFVYFREGIVGPFSKSTYWDGFRKIFFEPAAPRSYYVETSHPVLSYKSFCEIGINKESSSAILRDIILKIKEEYKYLSFEMDYDGYLTRWRYDD